MRLASWNRRFRRFCLNANGRTHGRTDGRTDGQTLLRRCEDASKKATSQGKAEVVGKKQCRMARIIEQVGHRILVQVAFRAGAANTAGIENPSKTGPQLIWDGPRYAGKPPPPLLVTAGPIVDIAADQLSQWRVSCYHYHNHHHHHRRRRHHHNHILCLSLCHSVSVTLSLSLPLVNDVLDYA